MVSFQSVNFSISLCTQSRLALLRLETPTSNSGKLTMFEAEAFAVKCPEF